MGDGESAATERPFQSMNAVDRMRAKLRTWPASWRGWRAARAENMVMVRAWGLGDGQRRINGGCQSLRNSKHCKLAGQEPIQRGWVCCVRVTRFVD